MRSITVVTEGQQLLLLLPSSTAIYTVQIYTRTKVMRISMYKKETPNVLMTRPGIIFYCLSTPYLD